MRTNRILTLTAATALLFGTAVAAAQTTDPDQDAHHPEQTQEVPAAQPQQPGAASQGAPGMMGMNPQMMQMMQRMMRMQQDSGQAGMGMMGPGMGMMGRGMMRRGGMHAGMARMAFILLDTDGDGALSLEEVQAVTERIFNAIDADDDGRATLEELQAFHRGTGVPAQQTQMRQDMPMQQGMQMPDGMPMPAASQAYMDAMQTMMEGMADMEMTGDAAIDFALMMIPHHQSAIDMAEALLEHGDDPELTELANAIIAEQQREIEFLENWLRQQGQRQ